jgi:hypothetical protein
VQGRADVLVLQFNRRLAPTLQLLAKASIELGLVIALLQCLKPEHLEVRGDRRLNLSCRPVLSYPNDLESQATEL